MKAETTVERHLEVEVPLLPHSLPHLVVAAEMAEHFAPSALTWIYPLLALDRLLCTVAVCPLHILPRKGEWKEV